MDDTLASNLRFGRVPPTLALSLPSATPPNPIRAAEPCPRA